jgi:hypothetical protein
LLAVPGPQSEQVEAPASAKLPTGQAAHGTSLRGLMVPAAHALHAVEPCTATEPAEQRSQNSAPTAL